MALALWRTIAAALSEDNRRRPDLQDSTRQHEEDVKVPLAGLERKATKIEQLGTTEKYMNAKITN